MPLQATSGAASYDAFGGGVPVVPTYIEDVFSTYLYTGNGSVQSISNGINLGNIYGGSGFFNAGSPASPIYLTAPSSSSYQFTGDYTVEAWIYLVTRSFNGTIYGTGGSGAADQFTYTASGELYFANQGTGTGVITAGSWIHVAAARSGTTQKIFVNGVVQSTTTVSGTIGQNATAYIGRRVDDTNYVDGYISNLRVVNGTAVYTSNFTPSTVPLTAITNTVLLTCQANGFVDASTNAFTITNTNAIATTNYGPFTSAVAGKGGLVWIKARNTGSTFNCLFDTARGATKALFSNVGFAQGTYADSLTSFNTNGFSLGADGTTNFVNFPSGQTEVAWTFREQPKFFDIVTFTGTGSTQNIAHNLGSTPGCIIVKSTSSSAGWAVYHRSIGATNYLILNATNASAADIALWNNTSPTSTQFTVGTDAWVNGTGSTYVAYLFAHDAGGFGLTGTDNVISCGSFTSDGATDTSVTLGYEPQWVMMKKSSGVGNWFMLDTMRRWNLTANDAMLIANLTDDEGSFSGQYGNPTATGFVVSPDNIGSGTFIYIAIRRGPMKVPTSGTSVFYPTTYTGTGVARTFSGFGFPPDMELSITRGSGDGNGPEIYDKLRGPRVRILTAQSDAEFTTTESVTMLQDGISVGATTHSYINFNGYTKVLYAFKRAPSFFDEVCYTGNATDRTITHNLTVAPELMIVKSRSAVVNWKVYQKDLGTLYGGGNPAWQYNLTLNSTASTDFSASRWSQDPTATVFGVATNADTNGSGSTYVAYLFATCAGVSKVGSYTGDGTNYKDINCGFTSGARFVMIKRTDAAGDWYVFDTARGITTGSDKILRLNSTAAEITSDEINPLSTGFSIGNNNYPCNVSGGTYIFLAIA